jgi:hypothetical protein
MLKERRFPAGSTSVAVAALALFDLLFLFAMRCAWSGIAEATGIPALPCLLMAFLSCLFLAGAVLARLKPRRAIAAVFLGASLLFLAALSFVFALAIGSWTYILRELLYGLAFAAGIALLAFLLFLYPKTPLAGSAAFKTAFLSAASLLLVLLVLDLRNNGFAEGPAAFAVGREYQIVFTTRARSRAWVEAGGKEYYDAYAGSDRSETTVHKIAVPMEALDAARAYRISAKSMILRGPYSALQGRTISLARSWRPMDESDGIQCCQVSDTHEFTAPAIAAGGYFGDRLDFLVMNGDIVSFIDRGADLEKALVIAAGITKGERPAVFARGNHETKGRLADRYHRYVGAAGEDFFYSFRLGSLWGLVLDLGEDHADGWPEYYGSARFGGYRARQSAFMDGLAARAGEEYGAPGVRHRIAVCHIPVAFRYDRDYLGGLNEAWTARLNAMGLDLMLDGHRHMPMYLSLDLPPGEPLRQKAAFTGSKDDSRIDGYRTNANFPALFGSRRSAIQATARKEDLFGRELLGLALDFGDELIVARNTDVRRNAVRVVAPWNGEDLGDSIKILPFRAR